MQTQALPLIEEEIYFEKEKELGLSLRDVIRSLRSLKGSFITIDQIFDLIGIIPERTSRQQQLQINWSEKKLKKQQGADNTNKSNKRKSTSRNRSCKNKVDRSQPQVITSPQHQSQVITSPQHQTKTLQYSQTPKTISSKGNSSTKQSRAFLQEECSPAHAYSLNFQSNQNAQNGTSSKCQKNLQECFHESDIEIFDSNQYKKNYFLSPRNQSRDHTNLKEKVVPQDILKVNLTTDQLDNYEAQPPKVILKVNMNNHNSTQSFNKNESNINPFNQNQVQPSLNCGSIYNEIQNFKDRSIHGGVNEMKQSSILLGIQSMKDNINSNRIQKLNETKIRREGVKNMDVNNQGNQGGIFSMKIMNQKDRQISVGVRNMDANNQGGIFSMKIMNQKDRQINVGVPNMNCSNGSGGVCSMKDSNLSCGTQSTKDSHINYNSQSKIRNSDCNENQKELNMIKQNEKCNLQRECKTVNNIQRMEDFKEKGKFERNVNCMQINYQNIQDSHSYEENKQSPRSVVLGQMGRFQSPRNMRKPWQDEDSSMNSYFPDCGRGGSVLHPSMRNGIEDDLDIQTLKFLDNEEGETLCTLGRQDKRNLEILPEHLQIANSSNKKKKMKKSQIHQMINKEEEQVEVQLTLKEQLRLLGFVKKERNRQEGVESQTLQQKDNQRIEIKNEAVEHQMNMSEFQGFSADVQSINGGDDYLNININIDKSSDTEEQQTNNITQLKNNINQQTNNINQQICNDEQNEKTIEDSQQVSPGIGLDKNIIPKRCMQRKSCESQEEVRELTFSPKTMHKFLFRLSPSSQNNKNMTFNEEKSIRKSVSSESHRKANSNEMSIFSFNDSANKRYFCQNSTLRRKEEDNIVNVDLYNRISFKELSQLARNLHLEDVQDTQRDLNQQIENILPPLSNNRGQSTRSKSRRTGFSNNNLFKEGHEGGGEKVQCKPEAEFQNGYAESFSVNKLEGEFPSKSNVNNYIEYFSCLNDQDEEVQFNQEVMSDSEIFNIQGQNQNKQNGCQQFDWRNEFHKSVKYHREQDIQPQEVQQTNITDISLVCGMSQVKSAQNDLKNERSQKQQSESSSLPSCSQNQPQKINLQQFMENQGKQQKQTKENSGASISIRSTESTQSFGQFQKIKSFQLISEDDSPCLPLNQHNNKNSDKLQEQLELENSKERQQLLRNNQIKKRDIQQSRSPGNFGIDVQTQEGFQNQDENVDSSNIRHHSCIKDPFRTCYRLTPDEMFKMLQINGIYKKE